MSGTDGSASICGQGYVPPTCEDMDPRIDGATAGDGAIFKVYAVFPFGRSPRVMGLTWGIDYDANNIIVTNWGNCGDFELNDTNWPRPQRLEPRLGRTHNGVGGVHLS